MDEAGDVMIRHFTAYEPNAWGVCGHKHPTIASAAKCAHTDTRREVREVRGSMIMAAVLVPSRATVSALAVAPKKETTRLSLWSADARCHDPPPSLSRRRLARRAR